jgi:hypothetical protein
MAKPAMALVIPNTPSRFSSFRLAPVDLTSSPAKLLIVHCARHSSRFEEGLKLSDRRQLILSGARCPSHLGLVLQEAGAVVEDLPVAQQRRNLRLDLSPVRRRRCYRRLRRHVTWDTAESMRDGPS